MAARCSAAWLPSRASLPVNGAAAGSNPPPGSISRHLSRSRSNSSPVVQAAPAVERVKAEGIPVTRAALPERRRKERRDHGTDLEPPELGDALSTASGVRAK